MLKPVIRDVRMQDADAIGAIYNHYIQNTVITFEEEPLSRTEVETRIADITAAFPWLVCEQEGRVVGYAYAGKWKARSAYRYSVESTVYLDASAQRKGIGTQLYSALLERLRALSVHVVIGGIALPNPGSVALHEKFGFAKVAHLREMGWKFDRWIDVGYWQLAL